MKSAEGVGTSSGGRILVQSRTNVFSYKTPIKASANNDLSIFGNDYIICKTKVLIAHYSYGNSNSIVKSLSKKRENLISRGTNKSGGGRRFLLTKISRGNAYSGSESIRIQKSV